MMSYPARRALRCNPVDALAALTSIALLATALVACGTEDPGARALPPTTSPEGLDAAPESSAIHAASDARLEDASEPDASADAGVTADTAPEPETPPEVAAGVGLSDPPTNTLHNHGCAGVDWQRIHGWLLLPHEAPELGPSSEMERCVARYAGWVTNEADRAGVSRASVYAGLAATGQCSAEHDYDGAVLSGALCATVHPELGEAACLLNMAATRAFGVATLADVLGHADALDVHKRDVPLMGAFLGRGDGTVGCGSDDRWRLSAPDGFVDRYVAAYNAYKARSAEPPSCKKRVVATFALYTGLDTPGVDGVTGANGCWTYERVSKQNPEWKLCNYDGTVTHASGVKWAYDDTNTSHDTATEKNGILSCRDGVPGRGYVYMTNRGAGWPKVVTQGVDVHFAEIYSGQYAVDDQFTAWKSAGSPGEPMIHLGEATTSASKIKAATSRACAEVADGGYLGVYVYPESLRGERMSAFVEAMNACTGS